MIAHASATPRLLSSAVEHCAGAHDGGDDAASGVRRGGVFSGNGLAIFLGILIGAGLICGVATLLITREPTETEDVSARARLIKISATPPPAVQPTPASVTEAVSNRLPVVEITPDMFHVTAISLGHPRLAVINRQQVAEGDWVVINTPQARISVKLQVIKIADGQIALTVGDHVMKVRLEQLDLKPRQKG